MDELSIIRSTGAPFPPMAGKRPARPREAGEGGGEDIVDYTCPVCGKPGTTSIDRVTSKLQVRNDHKNCVKLGGSGRPGTWTVKEDVFSFRAVDGSLHNVCIRRRGSASGGANPEQTAPASVADAAQSSSDGGVAPQILSVTAAAELPTDISIEMDAVAVHRSDLQPSEMPPAAVPSVEAHLDVVDDMQETLADVVDDAAKRQRLHE